ncbi:hypothetical protein ACFX1Q_017083 [Malus domestica]
MLVSHWVFVISGDISDCLWGGGVAASTASHTVEHRGVSGLLYSELRFAREPNWPVPSGAGHLMLNYYGNQHHRHRHHLDWKLQQW